MASYSSSSCTHQIKYDVFISFRGEDTRDNITSHLHAALVRNEIETFIDNRLERGDEISPALVKAIRESKLSVIVFSENYATSAWCLDELVHILDCRQRIGQLAVPIFYHVNPSHVRKQEGSYATAFDEHQVRFMGDMVKLQNWKAALKQAASLSGFDYATFRYINLFF